MTREEEIEKAANEIYPPLHPAWEGNENIAFQSGAEWADANRPDYNEFIKDYKKLQEALEIAEKALHLALSSKNKDISIPAAKALSQIQRAKG
jgi:hypothetical protein